MRVMSARQSNEKAVAIEGTQTIANTAEFIWKNAANMMTRMSPSAFQSSVVACPFPLAWKPKSGASTSCSSPA